MRYRDFRILTAGTGFAIAGWWMIVVAQGWLILELTDSPFWVAAGSSAMAVPSLILGPAAGVAADRLYRRHLLIVTRSLVVVLCAVEGVMILAGLIAVWQVLLFAGVIGSTFAMDIPARQSLIPDTVPEPVVANGVAINVSIFSVAAIVGPAIGAVLLATIGAGGCFLANAVGNVALVIAVMVIRIPHRSIPPGNVLADFVGGLSFVRRTPAIFLILSVSLLSMLGTSPWRELAPVFVRDVFHSNETGLGALYMGAGVGSVIGALLLLWLARFERRAAIYAVAITCGLAAVFGFVLSPNLEFAVAFALANGLANQLAWATAQTVMLLQTPEDLRGRIMSLWMLLWGVQPAATLVAGTLAQTFAPRIAVGGMATAASLVVLAVALSRRAAWRDF